MVRCNISIILPCYNCEDTIENCLLSIINQNYNSYEIIVVDDGSTDNTFSILNRYKEQIHLIKTNQNNGPSFARNIALRRAKGKILFFLDSDTTIEKGTLELVENYLSHDEFSIIGIQSEWPLNKGAFPSFWAFYRNFIWKESNYDYTSVWTTNRGAIRKEVFEKVGFFSEKYKGADVEDLEYGYRISEAGYRTKICRDIIVSHEFPTWSETIKKIPKRTYLWIDLIKKRGKLDNVSTSSRSVIESFIALSFWINLLLYWKIAALFFIGFLFYKRLFYIQVLKKRPSFFIFYPLIDIFIHLLPFGAIFYYLKRREIYESNNINT